jgi:class 3 adenylate cyclase/CHASE2 domain-containing sensor protein
MGRTLRRNAVVALIIAVTAAMIAVSPAFRLLNGTSIDALTALRWLAFGPARAPASSPVVVIALDEETYRTPPFAGTPYVTWTREIGRVLTAVAEGGAKVVGFDIVFPTSIEQSEMPFGDETLGAKVRGFDRDFLRALALASRSGKVVLGQMQQHQEYPLLPSPGQRFAVGQGANIRALNVYTDRDGIVRRLPLTFSVDGATVPSMAVELAARALGVTPQPEPDEAMSLGGYRIPAAVPNTMTLNFEGGSDGVPTYSLADLRACAEKGDTDFFRRHFDGKVVLIGTVLDAEDRKLTSKRFATAPEGARAERCALLAQPPANRFVRDSISGVYVHATAVNNLIHRDALTEFSFAGGLTIAIIFAALIAAAALALAPAPATLSYLGLAIAWTGAATMALAQAQVFPLAEPLIAGLLALGATIAYRFAIADQDKRLLRQSFALYLAPEVIEKLMASHKPPVLGGELRNITVLFSDVAGFSSFSEAMAPGELVTLMNTYLTAMTDIIEAHGGFVDKYIGDAIVAVFGAPLDDPDHAAHAVRAALACRARLEELDRHAAAFKGRKLSARIGLNSGEALVGNIGSHRRFNYTAMGDTVNLAARLEAANKYFTTTIMASEATVSLANTAFAWRELGAIRVKGRNQLVKVFEPLAASGEESVEQKQRAAAYAEALACWRARDFVGAAQRFATMAETDPPSALFLKYATEFAKHPPGPDWEPVTTLE